MKKLNKAVSVAMAAAMVAGALTVPAAAEEGTFKIGVIGPMTGDYAQYGTNVYNAAKIAIDEVNANGGFNGYQVELLDAGDDQGDGEKAVNAYNDLLDKGMQMLCGTVTSGACIAVGAEAAESTFLFTPSGSAVDCITAGSNEFRMCFTDPMQGSKSAQYISENGLATKIAILYDSSTDYNVGIHDAFVEAAPEYGLEIVADEAYTTDSNTDFSVQISKIKDSGAELLFLPNYYSDCALILQQAADAQLDVTFFGVDGMDGILSVENFDTSLAEGVMLLTPFSATAEDEATVNFVTAYGEANNGETPNQFAADAYDVIYAMQAAANDAGITPDMSNEDISAAMSASMLNIEIDGLTGAAKWTEDGECDKEPKAVVIKDGVYEMMQ
ncbi:ABC transporter substrate-binding protein [Marvinbryantia formatexigens DSM 14469]|nr:ABC transporter substrate-binding protein [Marvinbryantia formatexigens]UWO26286.1 ABC transporter substrate-binding protein [Marvinbryantia formatexigens DSM 14469]SDG09293.1 branched-chain amino acid transport system substrate-binding protein [Marvinbryantia formatexigens]